MIKSQSHIKSYRRKYKKYGVNPKSLKWQSTRAQKQRFEQIINKDLELEGKMILDVGCGFGDIIPFILRNAQKFDYTGVDIVPEFIERAKQLHPENKFLLHDYFNKPLKQKFDVIICCGALNSNVDDNLEFRKKAIKLMFAHATEVLVFNMAGSYPKKKTAKNSNVWFSDSIEIVRYCLTLTVKLILRHHYNKREFTVAMFR